MANKKITNETLAQMRRERAELLKLKKVQNGEAVYERGPTLEDSMPKTFWGKFKNFCYHGKWIIIVTIVLAITIALCVVQCTNREKYDMEIVAYSFEYVTDEQLAAIAEVFEPLCKDIDGDGVKNISPLNYSFTKSEDGPTQAEFTMAQSYQSIILGDPQALLFLLNEASYNHLVEINADKPFFEDEIIRLDEAIYKKVLEKTGRPLPEGLIIAYRKVEGTDIAREKISFSCHDAAEDIITEYNKQIAEGESTNE